MDFPKPTIDTGIGVHDDTNCYWKPAGFQEFVQNLRAHGVTWYLLFAGDENKADFARYLVRGGVMPILRLWPVQMPKGFMDMSHVEAYIAEGVKWIQCGNEFNLHEEWDCDRAWCGKEKPVRHVAEWYTRMADNIRARGGWPLTPPPSLGGHWLHRDWFTRFLTALQNIASEQGRTLKSILYPGGIGLHCRSLGNPLTAGPADYDVQAREWEWFDKVVRDFLGEPLPMANLEAFDEPQWIKPYVGANYDWKRWMNRNLEQMRWFDPDNTFGDEGIKGYKYPSYVFANCFWVYRDPNTWGWNHCALTENVAYRNQTDDGWETNLWRGMPSVITWQRRDVEPPPPPPPPPPPNRAKGFDVSSHQGDIDWAKAAEGHDFVYVRASAGLTMDSRFEDNELRANQHGLLRGAYHYLTSNASAADQANLFALKILAKNLELPPMLDIEADGLTQAQIREFISAFGKALGCYTSVWMWNDKLHLGSENLGLVPLWVADSTHPDAPQLPTAWDTWEFWQHNCGASVPGITGPVCVDRFNGTPEEMREKYPPVVDPLDVIMPLAEEKLAAMPVPNDWALPAAAIKAGYPIQVGGYGEVGIAGEAWAYQTFTRAEQDEYVVAYCKVGDWQNVSVSLIVRD